MYDYHFSVRPLTDAFSQPVKRVLNAMKEHRHSITGTEDDWDELYKELKVAGLLAIQVEKLPSQRVD